MARGLYHSKSSAVGLLLCSVFPWVPGFKPYLWEQHFNFHRAPFCRDVLYKKRKRDQNNLCSLCMKFSQSLLQQFLSCYILAKTEQIFWLQLNGLTITTQNPSSSEQVLSWLIAEQHKMPSGEVPTATTVLAHICCKAMPKRQCPQKMTCSLPKEPRAL